MVYHIKNIFIINWLFKQTQRSKLLRSTAQFSQLINAALFTPHPSKESKPTLPGVLPCKGRGKGV
jgi:hypothetical protein